MQFQIATDTDVEIQQSIIAPNVRLKLLTNNHSELLMRMLLDMISV